MPIGILHQVWPLAVLWCKDTLLSLAHRVVKAFEEAESMGRGSTSLDGKVIDVTVVKRARALLNLASRQL